MKRSKKRGHKKVKTTIDQKFGEGMGFILTEPEEQQSENETEESNLNKNENV